MTRRSRRTSRDEPPETNLAIDLMSSPPAGSVPPPRAPSASPRRRWLPTAIGTTILGAALVFFIDRPAELWLARHREAHEPAWLFDGMQWVTELGRSTWTFILAAILLVAGLLTRRARLAGGAVVLAASVALAGILANLAKFLIGRSRPKMLRESGIFDLDPFSATYDWNSFPSGHASTGGAIAGALWILLPRWRPLWALVGLAIPLSRVVVGAHYLGDALVGGVLGAVAGVVLAETAPRWLPRNWRGRCTSGPPPQRA